MPPSPSRKPTNQEPEKRGPNTEVIIAIIGLIGIIITAIIAPLVNRWLNSNNAPPPAVPSIIVITATDSISFVTDVVPSATFTVEAATVFAPPTNTPIPPTSTSLPTATPERDTSFYMEAENGNLGNGAYADQAPTASKGLCVNFNAAGTVKFTLRNMKAGQYTVLLHYAKYANGTAEYPDTGFQNLYVNNDSNPISVYYTKTFGDSGGVFWGDTSVTIGLEEGSNTLLLAAISGVIGGSVDYIYVNIIN